MRERDGTIRLDQYLKLAGVAATGGQAKMLVQYGHVQVNGEPETRRGRKLRDGDTVTVDERSLTVALASAGGDEGAGNDGGGAGRGDRHSGRDPWEDPERVQRFAARDPDQRLAELVGRYPEPATIRVLDLGCAGGRNTVFLLEHGFDVQAVDASRAMVAHTRTRVAALRDAEEADRRVFEGRMDDLAWIGDASFDLIVALGIYHEASSDTEWQRALAESARVLRPGGRLLVATFAPGTVLDGATHAPLSGSSRVHARPDGTTLCLVDGVTLDRDWAAHGLVPEVTTRTVERQDGESHRVTVNALYAKTSMRGG